MLLARVDPVHAERAARRRSSELRSMTVGTMSGKSTRARRSRSRSRDGARREDDVRPLALRRLVDRRRGEPAVERLPDDDGEHRAVRELRDLGRQRASPPPSRRGSRPSRAACCAPRLRGVEVDLRPEVVEGRRVRREPVRRRQDLVAALAEQEAGGRGRARSTPLPFRTVIVVSRGAGACRLSFSPSATAVAFSDDSTSGCVNSGRRA